MASPSASNLKSAAPNNEGGRYTWIMPRFWHGMRLGTFVALLARHRFRLAPSRLYWMTTLPALCAFNSVARGISEAVYGRRADSTEMKQPPIFIIGHWRSGTTLLHELLVLDERHTFPTTFQSLVPNHFLLTQRFMPRWSAWSLPKQRPMDGMRAGWDLPQEDEFALMNMGLPSPYVSMAFPNDGPQFPDYLDLNSLSTAERERWKEGLLWFLKRLTLADSRQVVLKSPPHTARIRTLLELFPEARFVHIVRDPFHIFPSTVKLWTTLNNVQGLQRFHGEGLEKYVLNTFERMYDAYRRDRDLVDPSRLYEIRYEDLIADPLGRMESLYEHLDLGGFEQLRPKLAAYFDRERDYRPNHWQLTPAIAEQIADRWSWYLDEYDYSSAPTIR